MTVECQNCGNEVTKRYARVRARDAEKGPRCCPECPDKIWDGGGRVRDAKSTRRDHRGESIGYRDRADHRHDTLDL